MAPFPGVGAKWQVSNGGITTRDVWNVMDWSADGKNLRYQQGDKIFNVEVHINGSKPEFSAPKEITSLPSNLVVISILPMASSFSPLGRPEIDPGRQHRNGRKHRLRTATQVLDMPQFQRRNPS